MSDESKPQLDQDRQLLNDARSKGTGSLLVAFFKLSGPGWLQSAITLGGGSLAGSLYLGIIGGYEMMWLQPLMMIFGVVMLSAIGYVALSTGERPFRALNTHVNPVLGWGWAIATLMANLVWAMPQFSLGTAALRQNLGVLTFNGGDYVACFLLFAVAGIIIWFYDSGGKGIKIFEIVLKMMVGIVVLRFFAVVITMTASEEGLAWGSIIAGFIPKPGLIFHPAESLRGLIESSSAAAYWNETIISAQRDRMVAAAATAVGINMTFLLPYSMMKRGWDRGFRGLAVFDLSTGLFIPFLLATSCVVIAAASQFHARPEPGLIQVHQAGPETEVSAKLKKNYEANLTKMLTATTAGFADLSGEKKTEAMAALPEADRILAATLIKRDAFDLANSLERLAGKPIAQYVFGIGVVGMAISSIIILMLINGFTICEILDKPSSGMLHRLGCYMPGVTGVIGALFLWSGEAKFYLAVPTSRFGMVLLPIAYIAFFCLMNNRKLLGDAMPKGGKRVAWNGLMGIGVILAMIGATISILNDKAKLPGSEIMVKHIALGLIAALAVLAIVIQFTRAPVTTGESRSPDEAEEEGV